MWNKKKESNHIAVINSTDHYTIVHLTFSSKVNLFTLHHYETIQAFHGEYGSHYFINHTLFFNTITRHVPVSQKNSTTIALLFTQPFIAQEPPFALPSFFQKDYIISHPLLLQCTIIPRIHNIIVTIITETQVAYNAAIFYTDHPYDEYSFSRLFTKKNSADYVPHEHYYNAIAAGGSYLMEHA